MKQTTVEYSVVFAPEALAQLESLSDYIAQAASPEVALRLAKAIGRSPESWLAMQDAYNLWIARQSVDLHGVGKLKLATT